MKNSKISNGVVIGALMLLPIVSISSCGKRGSAGPAGSAGPPGPSGTVPNFTISLLSCPSQPIQHFVISVTNNGANAVNCSGQAVFYSAGASDTTAIVGLALQDADSPIDSGATSDLNGLANNSTNTFNDGYQVLVTCTDPTTGLSNTVLRSRPTGCP